MIRNVIASLTSRGFVMALTLLIVIMNARVLGDEGQGTAALIQLAILLIVSVAHFITGGALVYLVPRIAPRALLGPAYAWSIIVASLFYIIFEYFDVVTGVHSGHLSALGLLQALFTFHLHIAIGKERLVRYNFVIALQTAVLALTLALLLYLLEHREIDSFIYALYVSFGTTYVLSIGASWRYFKEPSEMTFWNGYREMWRLGRYAQLSNLFQLMNYRSNLYLLERLLLNGRGAAGVFSIGMYAGEAIWSIGKSLSIVQYARLSNSTDGMSNRRITIHFFYLSFMSALALVLLMISLPEQFYLSIFGSEMRGVKTVLIGLAPGIAANSITMIMAHHFSGTGRHSRNTVIAAIGLLTMIGAGVPLISLYALTGAAIAASCGYTVQALLAMVIFIREDGIRAADFKIRPQVLAEIVKTALFKLKQGR